MNTGSNSPRIGVPVARAILLLLFIIAIAAIFFFPRKKPDVAARTDLPITAPDGGNEALGNNVNAHTETDAGQAAELMAPDLRPARPSALLMAGN